MLPLFATCDRWDIGGVSRPVHPDTGQLDASSSTTATRAARASPNAPSHTARAWLTATRETIAACECVEGCPSCVQSPKCGNQNNPLDKSGAIRLLDVLLGP